MNALFLLQKKKYTPALHKNMNKLRVESSSFSQGFDMRGEKLLDFTICADGKGSHAAGFGEPAGPVDDVSADGSDMMEGPELYAFERSVALFVGDGHLELAA